MDAIKTTFPFIYIKQIDFCFIFVLTPDDLFVKRGDKNFFLLCLIKIIQQIPFCWVVLILQDFILEEKFI